MPKKPNRYAVLLEHIFTSRFRPGATRVVFERTDIETAAAILDIALPKNLGDAVYSFRYRNDLPEAINATAVAGTVWIIRPGGRSRYVFDMVDEALANIRPNRALGAVKIPDATPGVIACYAKGDEQALLARLRYNRLIDIFTGVTCYSLQSHLRTTVQNLGQVETDEVYVGIDRQGAHYVLPVQAKGGKDRLSIVQIEQDVAMCAEKFECAICRPIAAQFMEGNVIAMFAFQETENGVRLHKERHYQLVPHEQVSAADLATYAAAAGMDD